MKQRLFLSLRQQLVYEISFVRNVSRPYRDAPNKLDIIDFEYRDMPCKLVLNGKLMLKTKNGSHKVESYKDLVKGLIRSKESKNATTFN